MMLITTNLGGFSPKTVSGLVGWWDASNNTTITYNTTKASAWADLSGNSNTLSQSNSALQWTPTTNLINGLQAMVTVATATNAISGMINSNISSGSLSSFSFGMLCQPRSLGTAYILLTGASAGGFLTGDLLVETITSATQLHFFAGGSGNGTATSAGSFANNTTVFLYIDYDGTTAHFYFNNTLNLTTTTNLASKVLNKNLSIGGQSVNAGDNAFTGYVGEVVLYNSVLSSSNRTSLYNYVKSKWGL